MAHGVEPMFKIANSLIQSFYFAIVGIRTGDDQDHYTATKN